MKKVVFILAFVLSAAIINAQTKTSVQTSDLQKSITEYIAKTHPGFNVKEANKVETKGVATYEVVIAKGTVEHTLIFNKDGKFVKQQAVKSGSVKPTAVKSKTTTKPAATTTTETKKVENKTTTVKK